MTFLVVALAAEARPIADRLGLGADPAGGPFRVFEGAGRTLAISGIGKAAAAAATGYLLARAGSPRDRPWLNVGLAGHPELPLGSGALAHTIEDRATGRVWYPPLVFEPPGATARVITVDRVEEDYAAAALYEMEASGFYATAARFATGELVQVYKVVSDNRSSPVRRMKASEVSALVEGRLDEIEGLIGETEELASMLPTVSPLPEEVAAAVDRLRFSVTERRRLARLWRRLAALEGAGAESAARSAFAGAPDARRALARLEERIGSAPARLT